MLGEAALTSADAQKYLDSYSQAIDSVGKDTYSKGHRPTISIKLSALHPRYEVGNEERVMTELFASVKGLIKQARALNVGITIDAEEADRLELSLKLFEKLYRDEGTQGWGLFGLVVQAYSKRCLPVLAWLSALAKEQGDRIPLRLVKGAYWDSEIKLCQQRGLNGYPVYTRKEATDVSYLACAKFLLSAHTRAHIFPQFASHNAHTIATIATMAEELGARTDEFEFQRLHGMGDALYNRLIKDKDVCVRIYAPVGSHKDLLPYLVRRLLENGANSSFVHRLVDARCPISELVGHPVMTLKGRKTLHNPNINLPKDMFSDRRNSYGPNIEIESQWFPFKEQVNAFMGAEVQWHAHPIVGGQGLTTATIREVTSPYDRSQKVGEVQWGNKDIVDNAIEMAHGAYPRWSQTPADERAACLERFADLMEQHYAELVAICHREAGKTIQDSIDEVREAVDFCNYYAQQARKNFAAPKTFTNYLGQEQQAHMVGRGVFACISPWNFPLAIFAGQVVAALAAGNAVVCKAAEQTSIIAFRAVQLMHEAGIPGDVLHFLPGNGSTIGSPMTQHPLIAGLAFTGSTGTAQLINRTLASRGVGPVPVIAETGGQNAMIIDSTSLPEQVVRDAVRSAFASAGQRCSALRVMFVQEDIADRVIPMIAGAMKEQTVGLPYLHETDVGPVIDTKAQKVLLDHIEEMKSAGRLIAQTKLPEWADKGTFVAPTAFEISGIDQLKDEKFGPIMHVIRYKAKDLDKIIDTINQSGFGLTMGVHSRNESTCAHIARRARVGNLYINRDQVGAVVGVQPFGGQGLSGTGPKAGGPHYLPRFAKEQLL
jgi:RHH-type proline utilization regulon transcriptional repressor/proline dehydrogenase/delta 1-pyrroline-5-carboxylate dehydrogenase